MKRVIVASANSLLTRLRNSGFTIKEIYKMFKQETGLDVTESTKDKFKRWCEEFLAAIED